MGQVNIIESGTDVTITINGNNGAISAGGNGQGGDLILKNSAGNETIRMTAEQRSGRLPAVPCDLNGSEGDIYLGGAGKDGDLFLKNADSANRIRLDAGNAAVWLGGNDAHGDLVLFDKNGDNNTLAQATIHLNGGAADLVAGGAGQAGKLVLRNAQGQNTINFDGGAADLVAGGAGQAGNFVLRNAQGQDTINFNGGVADLVVGGAGQAGTLILRNASGKDTVNFNAEFADILIGGHGQGGTIFVYPNTANNIADPSQATIVLEGDTGDIILTNADCAEEFRVSESESVDPGTVMVLDQEGKLRRSTEPYDKKVAGVISGAGAYKPAIILDRDYLQKDRLPLALIGKVFCKVDAEYGSIDVGDLLTTSSTPGHAMKAVDPMKAFGAVIGKALRPLKEGKCLIPILVALQ